MQIIAFVFAVGLLTSTGSHLIGSGPGPKHQRRPKQLHVLAECIVSMINLPTSHFKNIIGASSIDFIPRPTKHPRPLRLRLACHLLSFPHLLDLHLELDFLRNKLSPSGFKRGDLPDSMRLCVLLDRLLCFDLLPRLDDRANESTCDCNDCDGAGEDCSAPSSY